MRIGRHRLVLAFSILLAVVYGASREDAVTRYLERGQLGRRHLTPPALPAREPHRWPFTPRPHWHFPRNGSRGQPFKVAAFPTSICLWILSSPRPHPLYRCLALISAYQPSIRDLGKSAPPRTSEDQNYCHQKWSIKSIRRQKNRRIHRLTHIVHLMIRRKLRPKSNDPCSVGSGW